MEERRALGTHDSLAYRLTRCAWHPDEDAVGYLPKGATDSERSESSVRMEERRALGTHDSLAYRLTRCAWHPAFAYSLTTFRAMRSCTSTRPTGLPS